MNYSWKAIVVLLLGSLSMVACASAVRRAEEGRTFEIGAVVEQVLKEIQSSRELAAGPGYDLDSRALENIRIEKVTLTLRLSEKSANSGEGGLAVNIPEFVESNWLLNRSNTISSGHSIVLVLNPRNTARTVAGAASLSPEELQFSLAQTLATQYVALNRNYRLFDVAAEPTITLNYFFNLETVTSGGLKFKVVPVPLTFSGSTTTTAAAAHEIEIILSRKRR